MSQFVVLCGDGDLFTNRKIRMAASFALYHKSVKCFLTNHKQCVRLKSFSSHDWLERRKKDVYVQKAKQEHYRCRSAFKLMEIDDKYKIIWPGQCVIDIGAAPGSWSQVLVLRTNANGKDPNKKQGTVVSIDRLPIYQICGAVTIPNMDFTHEASQKTILQILNNKKLNFVFSDMAPNATGVKALDQENIFMLAMSVLKFSVKNLHVGGGCLIKMWDSGSCKVVAEEMVRFYERFNFVKPDATQSDSSEVYLLARKFKGLKQSTEKE